MTSTIITTSKRTAATIATTTIGSIPEIAGVNSQ